MNILSKIASIGFLAVGTISAFIYTFVPNSHALFLAGASFIIGTLISIDNKFDEQMHLTRMHITATTIATAAQIDPDSRKMLQTDINKLFKKLRTL